VSGDLNTWGGGVIAAAAAVTYAVRIAAVVHAWLWLQSKSSFSMRLWRI
jgi:hypothetical protein